MQKVAQVFKNLFSGEGQTLPLQFWEISNSFSGNNFFCVHLPNKYLLSSYSVLGTVLGIENIAVNKARCLVLKYIMI